MSVTDHYIRAFLTTVDARSMTKAAAQLGVDGSTLSRTLSRLEHDIGVVLLERGSHGVVPTSAGERYYNEAKSILLHLDFAANVARSIASEREPQLNIGHVGSASLPL